MKLADFNTTRTRPTNIHQFTESKYTDALLAGLRNAAAPRPDTQQATNTLGPTGPQQIEQLLRTAGELEEPLGNVAEWWETLFKTFPVTDELRSEIKQHITDETPSDLLNQTNDSPVQSNPAQQAQSLKQNIIQAAKSTTKPQDATTLQQLWDRLHQHSSDTGAQLADIAKELSALRQQLPAPVSEADDWFTRIRDRLANPNYSRVQRTRAGDKTTLMNTNLRLAKLAIRLAMQHMPPYTSQPSQPARRAMLQRIRKQLLAWRPRVDYVPIGADEFREYLSYVRERAYQSDIPLKDMPEREFKLTLARALQDWRFWSPNGGSVATPI